MRKFIKLVLITALSSNLLLSSHAVVAQESSTSDESNVVVELLVDEVESSIEDVAEIETSQLENESALQTISEDSTELIEEDLEVADETDEFLVDEADEKVIESPVEDIEEDVTAEESTEEPLEMTLITIQNFPEGPIEPDTTPRPYRFTHFYDGEGLRIFATVDTEIGTIDELLIPSLTEFFELFNEGQYTYVSYAWRDQVVDGRFETNIWVYLENNFDTREWLFIEEVVPFNTQVIKNPDLPLGVSNVIQSGVTGIRYANYYVFYVDGVEISRSQYRESDASIPPIDEILEVGVKGVTSINEVEVIPFETNVVENPNLFVGEERVIQEGINGERIVTYEVTYVDGVETSRVIVEDNTTAPVNRVIEKGTKESVTEIVTITDTVSIPYMITYVETDELFVGEERILQAGVMGEKLVTYEVTYTNGQEVNRIILTEEIVLNATNQIIEQGNKERPTPIPVDPVIPDSLENPGGNLGPEESSEQQVESADTPEESHNEMPNFTHNLRDVLINSQDEAVMTTQQILEMPKPDFTDTSIYHPIVANFYDEFFARVNDRQSVQQLMSHTFVFEDMMPEIKPEEQTALNQLRWLAFQYFLNEFEGEHSSDDNVENLSYREELLRRLEDYQKLEEDSNLKEIHSVVSQATGYSMQAYRTQHALVEIGEKSYYEFSFWLDEATDPAPTQFYYNFETGMIETRASGSDLLELIEPVDFNVIYGVPVQNNYQPSAPIHLPSDAEPMDETESSQE